MPEQVKCSDCGFLAMRMRVSRELVEAEQDLRKSGSYPSLPSGYVHDPYPICFVSHRNFKNEIGSEYHSISGTVTAVQKTHDCEHFTKWQQGLTPKEHREMLQLKEEREWRARQEDADRRWRDEQAEKERRWREDEAKRQARSTKVEVFTVLAAAAIGAVATLVAVKL